MPIFIPKPEQQAKFFQDRLEAGEQIEATFWCEQRLPLLLHFLIDNLPMGELVFSFLRHRYFVALTNRRLLVMGSTGMHNPIPTKFEALPRTEITCSQFTNWIGHIAMDLTVNGEVRRYRMPRSQRQTGESVRILGAAPA